jgi:hypothetical protein
MLPFAVGAATGCSGWIPALGTGVSTVRYLIPQRTFKYVATVQSVTDETCHNRTFAILTANRPSADFLSGHSLWQTLGPRIWHSLQVRTGMCVGRSVSVPCL